MAISEAQIKAYARDGFVVLPSLFSETEADEMAAHFMDLRTQGEKPGDFGGVSKDDANQKYPRFIQMHNWDEQSKQWAADDRIVKAVEALIDDAAALQQTMLYFKPPGAMGQGLHQDQQYITKDPLIGVWVALDDTDEANGQMVVVPMSHGWGMMPVEDADLSESFTPGQSKLPEGAEVRGLSMKRGDTLFFHGKTIHGSYRNRTADRFRRSFIVHYVGQHSKVFDPAAGTHMRDLEAKSPEPA